MPVPTEDRQAVAVSVEAEDRLVSVAPPSTTAVTVKVCADPAETLAGMPATLNTGSIGMNRCGEW